MKISKQINPIEGFKYSLSNHECYLTILKSLFLKFFLLIGFLTNAQLREVSLEERVKSSDLVIEGRVTEQRSFWSHDGNMIYTGSTVEIFKIFKGEASSSFVEILTEGGIVGENMIKVEPGLSLKVGDIGIFTCQQVRRFELARQKSSLPQYEVYASVQGFIQYDLREHIAQGVFDTYLELEKELYEKLLPAGINKYKATKKTDFFCKRICTINFRLYMDQR